MTLDEVPELDPVIHAQGRLRVTATLAALAADEQITFPRLQELLTMTPGNLAAHLRKLEDASYITVTKTFRRRTPVTRIALSAPGRAAFQRYTSALQSLLSSSAGPVQQVRATASEGAAP